MLSSSEIGIRLIGLPVAGGIIAYLVTKRKLFGRSEKTNPSD